MFSPGSTFFCQISRAEKFVFLNGPVLGQKTKKNICWERKKTKNTKKHVFSPTLDVNPRCNKSKWVWVEVSSMDFECTFMKDGMEGPWAFFLTQLPTFSFGPYNGHIETNFGSNLGPKWRHFWVILGSFGSLWNILASFCCLFCCRFCVV